MKSLQPEISHHAIVTSDSDGIVKIEMSDTDIIAPDTPCHLEMASIGCCQTRFMIFTAKKIDRVYSAIFLCQLGKMPLEGRL